MMWLLSKKLSRVNKHEAKVCPQLCQFTLIILWNRRYHRVEVFLVSLLDSTRKRSVRAARSRTTSTGGRTTFPRSRPTRATRSPTRGGWPPAFTSHSAARCSTELLPSAEVPACAASWRPRPRTTGGGRRATRWRSTTGRWRWLTSGETRRKIVRQGSTRLSSSCAMIKELVTEVSFYPFFSWRLLSPHGAIRLTVQIRTRSLWSLARYWSKPNRQFISGQNYISLLIEVKKSVHKTRTESILVFI